MPSTRAGTAAHPFKLILLSGFEAVTEILAWFQVAVKMNIHQLLTYLRIQVQLAISSILFPEVKLLVSPNHWHNEGYGRYCYACAPDLHGGGEHIYNFTKLRSSLCSVWW